MLTMIWIFLLVLASIAFGYRGGQELSSTASFDKCIDLLGAAVFASAIALYLAAPYTVVPFYHWLDAVLPQQGSGIHEWTAMALATLAGLLLVYLPIATGGILEELVHGRVKARGAPAPRES